MKQYAADRIRSIALMGHSGAGKTSLAEAMLFDSGALTRMGRVEDGNTVADYDPEEKRRGISISLTTLPVEWQGVKLNFLDAPGYIDFVGEVHSAAAAADVALIVVDAVAGVEVGTEVAWQIAEDNGLARMIYLNKMARENANPDTVIAELRSVFGANFVPVQIPVGAEANFKGVIDLLSRKASMGAEGKTEAVPAALADDLEMALMALAEAAAGDDDELIMKFLDGEQLTPEEIRSGLAAAIRQGSVVPVLFGDATHNIGVRSLMSILAELAPTFQQGRGIEAANAAGETVTLAPDAAGPLVLFAFKTVADPFVGKLTYFRVVSGELAIEEGRLFNPRSSVEERLGQLFVMRGKEQINIDRLALGDIGAVAKLGDTITGDSLTRRNAQFTVTPPHYPNPLFEVAVSPKTQQDSAKMGPALTRLGEQDPTLRWRFESGTGQTILSGMGDTHVDVAVHALQEKFGVGIETHVPKVPYKETVTKSGAEQYRHKKQTGGAGQFGEVHMEVKPLERGAGFEYSTDRIFGGSISNSFFPSIEKGIRSVLEQGVIAGYPVVDVRAEIYDGKMHPVDSKDIAFQIAGREAFKAAFEKAGPVLLEPIVQVKVVVPDSYVGDIMGDLNTRRGVVQGIGQERGKSVVEAQVPLAEMQRYAADLRSLTQGRGIYSIEPSHYAVVPGNIAIAVIEAAKKEREEEK
ncbi:MAG: elongation factor G [Anaerolinea sp.]|nr:elongation factor G [Anaerolinea sp.]